MEEELDLQKVVNLLQAAIVYLVTVPKEIMMDGIIVHHQTMVLVVVVVAQVQVDMVDCQLVKLEEPVVRGYMLI